MLGDKLINIVWQVMYGTQWLGSDAHSLYLKPPSFYFYANTTRYNNKDWKLT